MRNIIGESELLHFAEFEILRFSKSLEFFQKQATTNSALNCYQIITSTEHIHTSLYQAFNPV